MFTLISGVRGAKKKKSTEDVEREARERGWLTVLSRRRRSHLFSTSASFLSFFFFSLHPALARSPFSLPLFPFLVSSSLFVPAIVTPLPFRLVRLLSRDSFLSHSLLIPKTLVPRPLFPEALTSPRRVFASLAGLGRQAGRRTSTRTFLLCSVQLCLFFPP